MIWSKTLRAAIFALASFEASAARAEDTSPEAVVQGQVLAYNAANLDTFAAAYANEVELFELPNRQPTITGLPALIARYRTMFTQNHPRAEVLGRLVSGSFVIDHEKTVSAGRSSYGITIYEVQQGHIRRVWLTPLDPAR